MKSNVILFDVETSPILAATFSLYPDSIHHDSVVDDWYIISAAWKTLGAKKVSAVKIIKPGDDYNVCKTLRDALAQGDVLVGHNLDKFDIKKLNARLIYHKLDPLPLIPTVDTLKEIKKIAQFTSHRLDYLGKHLFGQGKLHTSTGLWLRVMKGDKKALKQMVEYNKVDVIRLEQLYKRILPYLKSHPHIGVLNGKKKNESCPKCGASHIKRDGIRVTAAGIKKQVIQCLVCRSFSRIPYKEPNDNKSKMHVSLKKRVTKLG